MTDCKTQILATLKDNNCCSLAFLNTVFYVNAQIDNKNSNLLLNLSSELSNKILRILPNFYPNIEIFVWENFLCVKGNVFELKRNFEDFDLNYYPNDCDRLTILKTLFLLNGRYYYNADSSLNSKGYNLEFVSKSEKVADLTIQLLKENNFELKKTKRQSTFVVYTKNSNIICDLLVLLGATYSALDMQNNLAIRELRNNVNRQNNCFEFNLDKTINASNEQLVAINYILSNYSIDYLDENLKEVALARIANPEVSLNELRIVLNNKLSRAGIKYRLDKIIDLYNKLKGNK